MIGLLFGAKHPRVMPAMAHFLSRVVRHAHDYEWQSVLEFALHRHEQAAALQILDPDAWEKVPDEWNAHYSTLRRYACCQTSVPKRLKAGALHPHPHHEYHPTTTRSYATRTAQQGAAHRSVVKGATPARDVTVTPTELLTATRNRKQRLENAYY
jgi:hypothetical protein